MHDESSTVCATLALRMSTSPGCSYSDKAFLVSEDTWFKHDILLICICTVLKCRQRAHH